MQHHGLKNIPANGFQKKAGTRQLTTMFKAIICISLAQYFFDF
jgi:hypothetical protein